MIELNAATKEQKELFDHYIVTLIKVTGCEPIYHFDPGLTFARLSLKGAKLTEDQKNVVNLLCEDSHKKLLTAKRVSMRTPQPHGLNVLKRGLIINEINDIIYNFFIKNHLNERPKEMDFQMWAVLPSDIKKCWSKFDAAMRAYIIACISPFLNERFIFKFIHETLGIDIAKQVYRNYFVNQSLPYSEIAWPNIPVHYDSADNPPVSLASLVKTGGGHSHYLFINNVGVNSSFVDISRIQPFKEKPLKQEKANRRCGSSCVIL
jgi:hypothetical protein